MGLLSFMFISSVWTVCSQKVAAGQMFKIVEVITKNCFFSEQKSFL